MVSPEYGNKQVVAAPDSMEIDPRLRRELQQVLSRVRPDDLSVVELSAILDILISADRRVFGLPVSSVSLKHP
jgi:hypothetical protein